ncbi:MAG: response regulator [Bacteroidales bacterium]|nr:response regulator [Bacteroidales bacterium]
MAEKKLVFIVDDDPFILNLIKKRFESDALEIVTFFYGEECMEKLNMNPDLIILDYLFSKPDEEVMNGMAIFNKIKEYNEGMPVIILSGQDRGDIVLEMARKGIDDYIIKDETLVDNLELAMEDILSKEF